MAQRNKMLEERELLKKEYIKRQKTEMDASKKLDDLSPKLYDTPDGVMAGFLLTPEYSAECEKADKEEQEASANLRETLEKIWEINTKLQA